MPSSEYEGLAAYVDELAAATKLGKIIWKAVNPTTFVWETWDPKHARINLQRVERVVDLKVGGKETGLRRREVSLLFQVVDLDQPSEPILKLESADDSLLNEKLSALFDLVKTGITEKTMDFLRSILPK